MNQRILGNDIYHSFDDAWTNPVLVQLMLLMGKSPFFNVQLALGEFDNTRLVTSGASTTSGANPEVVLLSAYPDIFNDPNDPGGCPEISEWVRMANGQAVRAGRLPYLVGEYVESPRGGRNKILGAEIVKNVPLCRIATRLGRVSVVSRSHRYMQSCEDRVGDYVFRSAVGRPIESYDKRGRSEDRIVKMNKAGRGNVVKLELDGDHLYGTGHSPDEGTIGHNVKPIVIEPNQIPID